MNLDDKNLTREIGEMRSDMSDLGKNSLKSEPSMVTRTIDKTTYVVGLHFKEQGLTFTEVLKRVLKGAGTEKIS